MDHVPTACVPAMIIMQQMVNEYDYLINVSTFLSLYLGTYLSFETH